MSKNPITVFTKPWKDSIPVLGEMLAGLGVDGLELPVRPGYPVNPDNVAEELPKAARVLASFGQRIYSIAGPTDETTIAACGAAGVPTIRVCEKIDLKVGYMESVNQIRQRYEALVPALSRHHVQIGLQNHAGNNVGSAIGIIHAIGQSDPKHVGAVLDMAHCGLAGEPEEMAIDIAWSHLCMVNLKNAFRMRLGGPEVEEAEWRVYWTTGRYGYASWRKTAEVLKRRGYTGPICLAAEYSNPRAAGDLAGETVARLIASDAAYARSLFHMQPA